MSSDYTKFENSSRIVSKEADMVDYRRFDAIETDSEDEVEIDTPQPTDEPRQLFPSVAPRPPEQTVQPMTKKGKEGRIKFEHGGRTIYEWEQSLTEVNIYLEPPPGVTAKMLEIVISHRHLRVGLKGAPPFIDEDTGGPTIPDDSLWTLIDGELNINLQKMNKAEAWDCALMGQTGSKLDAYTQEETKKKLMLERFQEEVNWTFYSLALQCSSNGMFCSVSTASRVRLLQRGVQRADSGRENVYGWRETFLILCWCGMLNRDVLHNNPQFVSLNNYHRQTSCWLQNPYRSYLNCV